MLELFSDDAVSLWSIRYHDHVDDDDDNEGVYLAKAKDNN